MAEKERTMSGYAKFSLAGIESSIVRQTITSKDFEIKSIITMV